MGCYESRPESNSKTDHKSKKKKKEDFTDMAWERIIREVKLLKAVTQANQLQKFEESRIKISEYYSTMKCKGRKGYQCQYLECQAWCQYCGFMDYSDEDLRCLDDFSSAYIKKTQ